MIITINLQDKPIAVSRLGFSSDTARFEWIKTHPLFRLVCQVSEVKTAPGQKWFLVHEYATIEARDSARAAEEIERATMRRKYSNTFLKANRLAQQRWRDRKLTEGLI